MNSRKMMLVNNQKSWSNLSRSSKYTYNLLLLTVAAIPWYGLSIEIGATFRPSNVFAIGMTVMLLFCCWNNQQSKLPEYFKFGLRVITIITVITVLSNLLFILTENIDRQILDYFNSQFGTRDLSFLRLTLKPLQVLVSDWINFSYLLAPIFIIKNRFQIIQIAWIYVVSSSIQAILAIIQYLVYLTIGINIFPILRGGLVGSHIYHQDAIFLLQGVKFIRVNGLAGEPKDLALFLCAGISIIIFLLIKNTSKTQDKILILVCFLLHLSALILTFSTLGYACFGVGLVIYFVTNKNIFQLLFVTSIACFIILSFVSIPSMVTNIFNARFLDRLGFEDMDLIYLAFISKHPDYLLLGVGFGNFHLASFQQAQEIIPWKFGIILPKIGIFGIMAQSGIVGLTIFASLPIILISKLNNLEKYKYFYNSEFCRNIKNLIIYLSVTCLCLRYSAIGLLGLGLGFAVCEISKLDKIAQS